MKLSTFRQILGVQFIISFGAYIFSFVCKLTKGEWLQMSDTFDFIFYILLPIAGIILGFGSFLYLSKRLPIVRWLNIILSIVTVGILIEYYFIHSFIKAGGG